MAITYSIDGGADAAKFNINGTSGALTFKAAPDFEAPGDANGDNVYEVSVKATDAGGLSTSKLVKVTVTDVSEGSPPQITSAGAVTVKENSTTVMTVTATDPDDTTTPPVEPPIEPPVSGEWPGASNTGVPAGTALSNSGSITTSAAGQRISAKNISGSVTINHNNCILEKCKIKGGAYMTVTVKQGVTGTIIRDCEIDSNSTQGSCGINGTGTFQRNNIHHNENGINLNGSNCTLEDNWIHDQGSSGSPHFDGIQIDGGLSNVIVRHNTVSAYTGSGGVSALMIDNYWGPINDILVENNKLAGGGFTSYCDGQFDGGAITNVRYLNNRFKKGGYDYVNFNQTNPTFTGNVDDVTGAPINAAAADEAAADVPPPNPREREQEQKTP